MSRKKERRRKTRRQLDNHHLTPKSREGGDEQENLLKLKRYRHEAWHTLFDRRKKNAQPKCRTLEEVIKLLQRVHRIKGRCVYAKAKLPCTNTHTCKSAKVLRPIKSKAKTTTGKGN